jgi:anti-sigma factor RsiW
MNCERFKELVFEYVDGELSADEQASVAGHLGECSSCRGLLEGQKAVGGHVSKAFQERAAELRLSRGFEQRVLRALGEAPTSSGPVLEALSIFARRFAWAAAIFAAAVVVTSLWLVRKHSVRETVGLVAQSQGENVPGAVLVREAFVSTVYTFRVDGNRVTDVLEYRTNVVDGALMLSGN